MIEKVIDYTFSTDNLDILEKLNDENTAILNDVKSIINEKLSPFLKLYSFRRYELTKQVDLIQSAFEFKYMEHEESEYFSKNKNINRELGENLFWLLNLSENLIIMKMMSKRRFESRLISNLKLTGELVDIIWNMYDKNKLKIEKQVFYDKILSINIKINHSVNKLEEITENLAFTDYLLMDLLDNEK